MSVDKSRNHDTLRVAVIGLGRMGIRHLQAVTNLGMNVCGVADTAAEALDHAGRDYAVPPNARFMDAVAMLRETRPDALVVATTAPSHAQYVIAAAELGVRHILCEKPLAVSLAEVRAIGVACQRNGAALAVNHQMRFMANYSRVRDLIGSEQLGPLVSMLVAGSNFGLAMNASHYFEAFRYLTDSNIDTVQAWLEDVALANPRGPQFEDRGGRLLARTATGTAMFIDFSAEAGHGLNVIYTCRLGQIFVDELAGHMRVAVRKPEFRELPTARYGMPANVYEAAIEPAETVESSMQVWSALLDGRNYPDIQVGSHALACIVAAHVSHESGGVPVRLDGDQLPNDRKFPWA